MMDLRVKPAALREIIEEVDEDRSGFLDFEEFCQLSAKFLVEVDEEGNYIYYRVSHFKLCNLIGFSGSQSKVHQIFFLIGNFHFINTKNLQTFYIFWIKQIFNFFILHVHIDQNKINIFSHKVLLTLIFELLIFLKIK